MTSLRERLLACELREECGMAGHPHCGVQLYDVLVTKLAENLSFVKEAFVVLDRTRDLENTAKRTTLIS